MKQTYFCVALVFNKGMTKTLLINHNKIKTWLPAGGHIENNETPDKATLRELKEEVGIEGRIINVLGSSDINNDFEYTLPLPYCILHTKNFKNRESDEFTDIHFAYVIEAEEQSLTPKLVEVSDARWFTKKEVLELKTLDSVKIIVRHLMN